MKPLCTIEALEPRALLTVATDTAAEAPSVRLVTRSVVTRGTAHTFHLVVQSPAGLSPTTMGTGDVLVNGPRGFSAAAQVLRVAPSSDGTRQIVTCRVAAPGGVFDRSDNGAYRVSLREGGVADNAGAVAAPGVIGGFRVVARRVHAPPPVLPIPTSASAGALSATITGVGAWCDHMPGVWPEPDIREYLVVAVTLRNLSDQPLTVTLDRAYISFAEDEVGTPTDGISVMSPHGPPTGVKIVTLQPGQTLGVWFRGNGVYPEGRHDQRLYVTLQFSAGDATVAVRDSAVVMDTH